MKNWWNPGSKIEFQPCNSVKKPKILISDEEMVQIQAQKSNFQPNSSARKPKILISDEEMVQIQAKIGWEWNCLHISSSRPFARTWQNEMNNSNNLKSDQSMFSYSQTLEFYRMCVIVVVGNVVQHEWPILMRGGLFFCGGHFCGVLGVFLCGGFVFFHFFQGILL